MATVKFEHPFYPIVYVRGYAGSQGEVEETVADPYMGFNIGSTKVRQAWDGQIERHFFESPLVRLMKDFQYRDVFEGGSMMPKGLSFSPRSVFIYRYYDRASKQLGPGDRLEIEEYAVGLGELILQIRERLCQGDATAQKDFRIYLVAHSMGGLICRSFLQYTSLKTTNNVDLGPARAAVDKVFTYATPHNGIDLRVINNVPGFFSRNNSDNFNRGRMAGYLGFPATASTDNVASLGGRFDPNRFFCLVGTNHRDYAVAFGGVRHVVGPMSDGLVRIKNATVWDRKKLDGKDLIVQSPRAFVHRSHSGHYGIVNSEGGYQNLTRFLFGTVRIDGRLEVKELTLPPNVEKAFKAERTIRASYHFEVVVRTRGATWELHRRTVNEESAIMRTFDEMLMPKKANLESSRDPHLFSTYLSNWEIVKGARMDQNVPKKQEPGPLGFSIDLGVLVPQYEVDGTLWFDDHYDGGYIYREKLNLEAVPPTDKDNGAWRLRVGFDSRTPNRAGGSTINGVQTDGGIEFRVPISQKTRPGIEAELVITASNWNG